MNMFHQTANLSLSQKKSFSYFTIQIFMFFSGVEYALIFPSLWEYLQSLGVPEDNPLWLGATLSSITLTDILSGLVVGKVLDSTHNNRALVLILNCPQILGSILYLSSSSPLMLLCSRLVSGLGKGITIVFLSDICRSTDLEERTPVMLLFDVYFQSGLLLGPLFNMVLTEVEVGPVNRLNSPGLLLTLVWCLFSVLVMLLYRDLVKIRQEEMIEEELLGAYVTIDTSEYRILSSQDNEHWEPFKSLDINSMYETAEEVEVTEEINMNSLPIESTAHHTLSIPLNLNGTTSQSKNNSPREFRSRVEDIHRTKSKENLSRSPRNYGTCTAKWTYDRNPLPIRVRSSSRVSRKSDCFIDEAEKLMGESDTASTVSSLDTEKDSKNDDESENNVLSLEDYKEVLLREEVICLAFLRFVALFCQTSLESSIPPIMEHFFEYGDLANSVVYLIAGIELITICFLLTIVTKYVSDRMLVSSGLVLMLISQVWLGVVIPSLVQHNRSTLPFLVLGIMMQLMGISIICIVGLSLYSKLIPDHMQGFSHATRRFVSQFAILLGPLWGTGTMDFRYTMVVVPILILLPGIVMFLVSFQRMRPEVSSSVADGAGEGIEEEE